MEASCGSAVLAAVLLPSIGWWYLSRRPSPMPLPMPQALQASGAQVHPALQRTPDIGPRGSGLVVVAPVEEGEALLRVPQSAVLSGKMAQQVLGVDLEPDLALVALLAEARARAEEGQDIIGLKEYLLSLPRHFHGLPWVFDDEEAASELRGTALQPCLQLLQAKEDENRQVLQARLGERLATAWSAERFRWAKAVVMTRAGIHEVSEEPEPSVAIVPLIDFANCAEVPSAFCRLHKGFIELVTRQALKAGDEVTISYGEQSQEQQLFTFGFFLESSPVEIMTPLAMTVPTEVTTAVELRNVLLRLLFLERQNAEGSMADLPPFAMLRARSSGLDLSELYGVATLQELPENQLRQVADEVRKTSRLALPPPSSESLKRLKALLQEWHAELSVEASSSRSGEKPVFLRAYRKRCVELVEQALKQLTEKELEAALGAPLSL